MKRGNIKVMEAFMKKIKLLVVGLVILVALGMGFVSCGGDEDDGPSIFEGTWENTSEKITFSGNSFTFLSDGMSYTGTFTYSEPQTNKGTITFDFSRFSVDGSNWYNRNDFIDAMIRAREKITEASWKDMREEAKNTLRNKYRNEFAPPTSENGFYDLEDNTLELGSDSISGLYYQGGEVSVPGGPETTPPPAVGKGILRVYNKTTSAGNYIAKIEVSKEGLTSTSDYTGAEFSRNEFRDINLDPGSYDVEITRNTGTKWAKQTPVTITESETTEINFNILSDDWE
jgi:hypothetical protein